MTDRISLNLVGTALETSGLHSGSSSSTPISSSIPVTRLNREVQVSLHKDESLRKALNYPIPVNDAERQLNDDQIKVLAESLFGELAKRTSLGEASWCNYQTTPGAMLTKAIKDPDQLYLRLFVVDLVMKQGSDSKLKLNAILNSNGSETSDR